MFAPDGGIAELLARLTVVATGQEVPALRCRVSLGESSLDMQRVHSVKSR